jgi:hypothetical protein
MLVTIAQDPIKIAAYYTSTGLDKSVYPLKFLTASKQDMAFPLTCYAILSFSEAFAADALQDMVLLLITCARNATAFKRLRNEVFVVHSVI